MMQRLVTWVEKYAEHKHATKALSFVAFIESSFFPIPPFLLIIAMLSNENKVSWKRLACIGTLSSVLGGILGYVLGKFFYSYIGEPLVVWYGIESQVTYLGTVFKEHVFLTIMLASISPLPYKVFTLSAGLFSVNFVYFVIASLLGRGLRFAVVSFFADKYGYATKKFFLKQQKFAEFLFYCCVVLLVLYIILVKQGIL